MIRNEHELKALMRDIENDMIDKSEWLPRREANRIMEERAKVEHKPTIAFILTEKGFLEAEAIDYGFTLMELRNAFLGALNAKSAGWVLLQSFMGGADPKRYAGRMYDDIMRKLRLPRQRIIESALFDVYPAAGLPIDASNAYRMAFEALIKITDEVMEKIKADIEKGLADA